MNSHFNNLVFYIPDLKKRRILDLGCGKGSFLIEATAQGAISSGLEKSQDYINIALNRALEKKLNIIIKQGLAENIPFDNNSFDFVNMAEVIEHVDNPEKVLAELYRVLSSGGLAYISVPNRFSLKDPHFHLYFVNWLPRSFSDFYIGIFGKHKNYQDTSAGNQRLKEMHYYTFSQAKRLFNSFNFIVNDMREKKIKSKIRNKLFQKIALFIYKILRFFYFDSFHILLLKNY